MKENPYLDVISFKVDGVPEEEQTQVRIEEVVREGFKQGLIQLFFLYDALS